VKEIIVEGGKKITIYDDLFTMQQRTDYYGFVRNSYFKIGWEDGINEGKDKFLHSTYSDDDLRTMGIIEAIAETEAKKELIGFALKTAVVNLSYPSDANWTHTHIEPKILLYYPNIRWGEAWHGETLFYDEACKEVVYANPYVPGRLIAFDATIPHTIRPQSYLADKFRFTLAIILQHENI